MTLTIVITTFNRASVLKELLQSLHAQTDPDFQVVVAIDGSTDDTEAMLREADTKYPLRWVNSHCKGYGLAVSRNLGILEAQTDLVAIIDDDCFPEAGYVAAHKRSATRKTITGGPRTPASAAETLQRAKMEELARLPDCEPMSLDRLDKDWPRAVATECNICMYRSDLIQLGLFSERLKIYGFIGQEFFARARYLGYGYQYNQDAGIVHHRQPVGDNSLTKWRRKWQISVAKALRPSFMTPSQYLAQVRWACCMAERHPARCRLPPLPKSSLIAFPYRFARNRAGDVRRRLRNIIVDLR